jgi:hypothetical protein
MGQVFEIRWEWRNWQVHCLVTLAGRFSLYEGLAIGRRREAREVKVSHGRGGASIVLKSLPGSLPCGFESRLPAPKLLDGRQK